MNEQGPGAKAPGPCLYGCVGAWVRKLASRMQGLGWRMALKRAVALKVYDLMKKQKLSKSALAAEMRTSRAAIHRLLDPQNTSVTLATLNRAARSLG